MGQQWIVICLLIACAHVSHQISTPNSETYVAAVVEYSPQYKTDGKLTLKINTDAYVKHIKTANTNDADIIVFPEDGLTTIYLPGRENLDDWSTIIPDASKNYVPCDENTIEVSDTLKRISCAAKENQIYVVINIAEKLPCNKTTCTKYDQVYYNSNVVFDRNGKIIARYRKTNLYIEPIFNTTEIPEIITFDTDFGVKFGTFTCFDIIFSMPALYLTRIHKITDFVYPTAWFSEVPFLTAVQTHSGWSYAEDVNFLVAGYNNPSVGNTGSGIYLGRKGIVKAVMANTLLEKVLIHKVPKMKRSESNHHHVDHLEDADDTISHQENHHVHELRKKRENYATMTINGIKLIHDNNIHAFETFLLLERKVTKLICHNGFCCDFEVEILEVDPKIRYRLAVFSDIRRFGNIYENVSICSIIQCLNETIESCGFVQPSETIFKSLNVTATFYNYKEDLIMPSTLDSELYPLPIEDWSYDEHIHDNHIHINIYLTHNKSNISTFGLFSRNFEAKNSAT